MTCAEASENRTCDCEGQGAEKGAVLAKTNVPANAEVGLVAATTGAARGDGKEEWDSDSGASLHSLCPHTGRNDCLKMTLAEATVEVADGTILPVDGCGINEVDLDEPGTTTKSVKMVSVGYVPVLSRNLLSTRKAVEEWGKPLVYWFPGEKSLVFNFYPRKGLFSATSVRRTPSQGAALGLAAKMAEVMIIEATGQWAPCADVRWSPRQGVALVGAVKVHDMVEEHRVLVHTSEEITQKTVQAM